MDPISISIDMPELARQAYYIRFFKSIESNKLMRRRKKGVLRDMMLVFYRHGLTGEEIANVVENTMSSGAPSYFTTWFSLTHVGIPITEAAIIAMEIDAIITKDAGRGEK